jgi:hypothetical protein
MFQYKCPACRRFGTTERRICPQCGRALQDGDVYDLERNWIDSCAATAGWTFLGGILAPVYLYFGFEFGGGGHGWLLPLMGALTSFVTAPGTGLAWALRRTNTGWWIALCLMLFEMLTDVWFVAVDLGRDSGKGMKLGWEVAPVWVILWTILFLAHQLVAPVIVFFHKGCRQERTD